MSSENFEPRTIDVSDSLEGPSMTDYIAISTTLVAINFLTFVCQRLRMSLGR